MTPKGEWFKSYNEFASPTMVYLRDDNTKARNNWHWKVLITLKVGLTIEVQDVGHVELVK